MEKVVSEDSLRRAFQDESPVAMAAWLTVGLETTYGPALEQPWIADLDVTVKLWCAEPDRAREAITSRPLLLHAVGRLIRSGGADDSQDHEPTRRSGACPATPLGIELVFERVD